MTTKPPSTTPAPVIHRARVPVDGMQSCEVCGDILVDLSGAVVMSPNAGGFWPARALVEVDAAGFQGLIQLGAPTCTPQEQDPAILRRLLARANAVIADQRRTIADLARQGVEVRAVLDETREQLAAAENDALRQHVAPATGIEAMRVEGVVERVDCADCYVGWRRDDGRLQGGWFPSWPGAVEGQRVALVVLTATGTKEPNAR